MPTYWQHIGNILATYRLHIGYISAAYRLHNAKTNTCKQDSIQSLNNIMQNRIQYYYCLLFISLELNEERKDIL